MSLPNQLDEGVMTPHVHVLAQGDPDSHRPIGLGQRSNPGRHPILASKESEGTDPLMRACLLEATLAPSYAMPSAAGVHNGLSDRPYGPNYPSLESIKCGERRLCDRLPDRLFTPIAQRQVGTVGEANKTQDLAGEEQEI